MQATSASMREMIGAQKPRKGSEICMASQLTCAVDSGVAASRGRRKERTGECELLDHLAELRKNDLRRGCARADCGES